MIAIVDYGLGNIQAFANIYRRLGIPAIAAATPEALRGADKIILPGVGAFDWAMERLDASGLRATLDEMVLGAGVDVLGVCIGMQMMARRSEEGRRDGLGWVAADVRRFDPAAAHGPDAAVQLPHMGWNDAAAADDAALFADIALSRFYFLHSYYVAVDDPRDMLSITDYGIGFASAIRSANIHGTQFHPEKSHAAGVRLLQNFAAL